jgi:hypothetical protein
MGWARRFPFLELTPDDIAVLTQEFVEVGGDPTMLRFTSVT